MNEESLGFEINLEEIKSKNLSSEQVEVLTRIKCLEERVLKTKNWSRNEIIVLLKGAMGATLIGDIEIGSGLCSEAYSIYQEDAQVRNRNWYALSIIIGVSIAAIICGGVAFFASRNIANLATPDTIISLFAFAALGSLTSNFTRLGTLDFRNETSKKYIIYSAIARPIVAISFASITYVILKYQIVPIQLGREESGDAPYWVAAFLCGFSERFASDVLTRISGSKSP